MPIRDITKLGIHSVPLKFSILIYVKQILATPPCHLKEMQVHQSKKFLDPHSDRHKYLSVNIWILIYKNISMLQPCIYEISVGLFLFIYILGMKAGRHIHRNEWERVSFQAIRRCDISIIRLGQLWTLFIRPWVMLAQGLSDFSPRGNGKVSRRTSRGA